MKTQALSSGAPAAITSQRLSKQVCSYFASVKLLHSSAKSLVLLRLVAKARSVCSCFTPEPPPSRIASHPKLLNLNICDNLQRTRTEARTLP
jgi:hypothetical protein